MPHSTVYDLYLGRGCDSSPALADLEAQIPMVGYAAFQQWITTRQSAHLGFLQLDLPQSLGTMLLQRLQGAGARGKIINAAYRRPHISREHAWPLAEREIARLQAQYYPSYTFGPVIFYYGHPMTWTFTASSQQLIDEGFIPGALFADVDKLDGHIWQEEEIEAQG